MSEDTWEQTINFLRHCGLDQAEIIQAVKSSQLRGDPQHSLDLTYQELLLLKRIVWDLRHGVNDAWSSTDVTIQLNIPEVLDLNSIERKLWYKTRPIPETHTEGAIL